MPSPASVELTIHLPSPADPLVVSIADGEALLLGREPAPARLAPGVIPAGRSVRAVPVAAPSVSGNHALVWRDGDRVSLRDLHSRNGTTLALPADVAVSLPAAALSVSLAPTTATRAEALPAAPRDAAWREAEDFPEAVAREVGAWLVACGVPVTARARRRSSPVGASSRASLPPIPLVDDHVLQLVEEGGSGTIDPLRGRVIEAVVDYVHAQCARLRRERAWAHPPGFVLASTVIREAHRRVAEAAAAAYPLILLGETGAGKGTLARCYHLHSDRAQGPFEQVNCAEIDKHFARTRLFGARKGAYTGCHADVPGVVELAARGTLFLDEVAELPLDVQGELLTFLDDLRYKRFGDEAWRQADVRVVCGTNVDLRAAVRDGRFRADLWYRLAGRVVEVRPLRERRDDVVAFLSEQPRAEGAAGRSVWDVLDEGARRCCLEHPWRGNFRELAGFARRLPATGDVVTEAAAREAIAEGALELRPAAVAPGGWDALAAEATALYRARTQQDEPVRAAEFREYVEDLLKPLFFARALGMTEIDALPDRPTPSFEEMARRMGCDASTIKAQLGRYAEIRRASGGKVRSGP